MKTLLLKIFILNILVLFLASDAKAYTFDWNGKGTDWATSTNWTRSGSGGTSTYPGQTGTADIVNIGVSTSIAIFYTYPVIASANTINIASLNFGNDHAASGDNGGGSLQLTVNGILNVSGTILQKHSATGGAKNSGGTTSSFEYYTFGIITTIKGSGSITCNAFTVGDNTLPANNNVVSVTLMKIGDTDPCTLSLTVTTDLILNSANSNTGTVTKTSRSLVSVAAGNLIIKGTIHPTNNNAPATQPSLEQYEAVTGFSLDLYQANGNSPTLTLVNASAINAPAKTTGASNSIDFYNYVYDTSTGTGSEATTVIYSGTDQRIYTNNSSLAPDNNIDPNGVNYGDGMVYQNLTLSGSGTKTVDAGLLSLGGNLTLAAGTETLDLNAKSTPLTVLGNYTTGAGATLKQGTGTITFSGSSFTDNGTTTFGTGLVTFNSSAATTAFATTATGTTFKNVAFSGGGINSFGSIAASTGKYFLASNGVLTLSNNSQVTVASSTFILNSDATGSATIANIPSGCKVNGTVNVQRYVTGGAGYRGYRFVSSPVNAGKDASNNYIYSINYLLTSTFLTGSGNGFSKTGNPTLYLFRENLLPVYNNFLNSNFRGISDISTPPNYSLNVDGGPFNIPVGNGYLFFFRGDITTVNPYVTTTVPVASTLVATGTLNQGSISVHDWYNASSANLGRTGTSNSIFIKGYNLLGNPYASSIDWDTYSATNINAGIYAPNVGPFIYFLNANGNYGVYKSGSNGVGATNNATHVIPSGVGFFVIAGADSTKTSQLTFTEGAKINTQVTGKSSFMNRNFNQVAIAQYLKLQLAKDSTAAEDVMISFDANASPNFSMNEDAPYKQGTGPLSLSSVSGDNVPLAINELPLPKAKPLSIALKVSANADGVYAFNLTDVEGIPQLFDVILVDAYTNGTNDMRQNKTYSFNVLKSDTNTYGSKRFSLIIRQNPGYAYRLLNFTAAKMPNGGKQVQLTWKTENEQNYTRFAVERSTDNGKTYDVIGGEASCGQGIYSLVDKAPAMQNLYRLQQVDINDSTSYSKIITVAYSNMSNELVNNIINVYPNPATSIINLAIANNTNASESYKITVSNSSGLIIKQVSSAQTNWQAGISDLLPGTYLIKVFNNKDQSMVGTTKFVKQ